MQMQLAMAFLSAFVLSLALTPLAIRLANRFNALDIPNERKSHARPMPRLGGIAVFLSFFLCTLFFFVAGLINTANTTAPWDLSHTGLILFASGLSILTLGIWDDLRLLGPGRKFMVQLLLGAIVYAAGVRITNIAHPFSPGILELGIWSFPVTMLWIIGITNALNLIDGLDGLASGVGMLAAVTIGVIAYFRGDVGIAFLAIILAGSVSGFLPYNFNPARIFLGDSGSLFLGFSLSVLSILSSTKGSTAFAISIPVLALGVPIADTLLAMVRRFLRAFLPNVPRSEPILKVLKSIFLPDRDHIHHRLLNLGLSHRSAVLLLYVVSSALGCSAFALTLTSTLGSMLILLLAGTATIIGIHFLRYREIAIFKSGLLLPLYEVQAFRSTAFQGFLDYGFIIAAYSLSHIVAHWKTGDPFADPQFVPALLVVSIAQVITFRLTGIYKATVQHAGISDALRVAKSVFAAVGLTVGLMIWMSGELNAATVTMFILDFYFLLTFAGCSRFSYPLLRYLYRENTSTRKRVIIYGAGYSGMMALQLIRNMQSLELAPVGFLDDDPRLEGRRLEGFPIFGGHWKAERVVKQLGVKEIIFAGDSIKPEIIRRLKAIARSTRVSVVRISTSLEELQPDRARPQELYVPVYEFEREPAAIEELVPVPMQTRAETLPGLV